MRVRCFAVSNTHKQGLDVEILSVEYFPLAIDTTLSCGHVIRLNLDLKKSRFEVWLRGSSH